MGAANQEKLEDRAARLAEECAGENLDQLATLDMRGDGVLRVLYGAARKIHDGPLTLSAARALLGRVKAGDRVLILTGFLAPKPFAETDGLIGSAILAAALERACGAVPVFVSEPEVLEPLRAGLRAAGLNLAATLDQAAEVPHAAVTLPYTATTEPGALADEIDARACIAVERPGANPKGEYHFALGKNVSADILPIDDLYRRVAEKGVLTVAVGDFGNELGMGAIYAAIRTETPAGADCGCGCGGGTACATPADITVVASVSDWGAYGIAACVAYLHKNPSVLVGADVYRRVCDDVIRAGAIDGPTQYAVPYLDGIDDAFNAALLEVMRGSVCYPGKNAKHSSIRLFRAARLQGTA